MKSFAPVAAALFFAASVLAQNPPLVNTPINPPVCQPLLITWGGGTPPYFLSIFPGNEPNGNVLLDFGQQAGTSLTWTVNFTAGTSLGLNLRDSTGAVSQSGAFTVQTSTDTSCLNAKATSAASGSSSSTSAGSVGSTPATTAASTSIRATTSATSPGTSVGTSAAGTSASHAASSAASSTPTSAATAQKVSFGIAGALGAAVIALLA